jgi:hypothetical protein
LHLFFLGGEFSTVPGSFAAWREHLRDYSMQKRGKAFVVSKLVNVR